MKSNTRMCKHFWFQNPEFLRAPSPAAETGGILGNRWPSVSNEYVLREWSNHLLFQHALSNNLILLAVNRHALNTYSIRPKKEFFYIISLKSRLLHVRALWSKTMSVKVPGSNGNLCKCRWKTARKLSLLCELKVDVLLFISLTAWCFSHE